MELNIESLVREQIEHIDFVSMVRAEIRSIVSEKVGGEIINIVKVTAKTMVDEEVEKALNAEIKTNDGWGKRETYPSFEDLFRSTMQKAMNEKYQVQQVISKLVKERVDSLVKQDWNRVVEKFVDELTHSKLVKKS